MFLDEGSGSSPAAQPLPAPASPAPAQVATLYMEGGSSAMGAGGAPISPLAPSPSRPNLAAGAPLVAGPSNATAYLDPGAAPSSVPSVSAPGAATAYFDPNAAPVAAPLAAGGMSAATAYLDPTAATPAFATPPPPGYAAGAWPQSSPSLQRAAMTTPLRGETSTRLCSVLMGILLLAAFFVPFGGTSLLAVVRQSAGISLVSLAWIAGAGAFLTIFGLLPLASRVRSMVCAIAGLAGLALFAANASAAGGFDWRGALGSLGPVLLTTGALLANRAPASDASKYVGSVGLLILFVPLLVPAAGVVPFVNIVKSLGVSPALAIAGLLPLAVGLLAVVGPIASSALGEPFGWLMPLAVGGAAFVASGQIVGTLPIALPLIAEIAAAGFGLAGLMAEPG